jgi:hypothetical protein
MHPRNDRIANSTGWARTASHLRHNPSEEAILIPGLSYAVVKDIHQANSKEKRNTAIPAISNNLPLKFIIRLRSLRLLRKLPPKRII